MPLIQSEFCGDHAMAVGAEFLFRPNKQMAGYLPGEPHLVDGMATAATEITDGVGTRFECRVIGAVATLAALSFYQWGVVHLEGKNIVGATVIIHMDGDIAVAGSTAELGLDPSGDLPGIEQDVRI